MYICIRRVTYKRMKLYATVSRTKSLIYGSGRIYVLSLLLCIWAYLINFGSQRKEKQFQCERM